MEKGGGRGGGREGGEGREGRGGKGGGEKMKGRKRAATYHIVESEHSFHSVIFQCSTDNCLQRQPTLDRSKHTHIHIHAHTQTHTLTHIHTHIHMHTHTNTYSHTHTNTYSHTLAHTCTHTEVDLLDCSSISRCKFSKHTQVLPPTLTIAILWW